MNATATVTSRGQVTLPRAVRAVLDTRTVEFDIQDNVVLIRPVRSVAGRLSAYARKHYPISKVREHVWKEVASDKVQGRPS